MTEQTRSRLTLTTVLAIAAVAIVLLLLFLHSGQSAVEVRTATVVYRDLVDTEATIGKVEPIDEFQPHSSSPGTVEKLYVHTNQKVQPGQLLIKMDDADAASRLATATANLKMQQVLLEDMEKGGTMDERNNYRNNLNAADLRHQNAVKNLARVQGLQKEGAASAGEAETAEQQVVAAQNAIDALKMQMTSRASSADLDHARAAVADAQAAVNAAQGALAGADIRSPIVGTVYSVAVADYDYVPAGDPLLSVADLSHLQVHAYFDEPEIGKLAAGQPVTITWDAKPDSIWHGHITLAPTSVILYGTRNVGECLISVDDPDGLLLPNTNVTVHVVTRARPHVLSVPHEAVRIEGTRNYVYLIQNDRLVKTPVQIGVATLNSVEITGGLSEGQVLALGTLNNRDLSDNMRVKAVQ